MKLSNGDIIRNVILDTASETNLISLSLVNKLKLPVIKSSSNISGVCDIKSSSHGMVSLIINDMDISFLVVERIEREVEILIGWPSLDYYGISLSSFKGDTNILLNGKVLVSSSSHFNSYASNLLNIGKTVEVRVSNKVSLQPLTQKYIKVSWDKKIFHPSSVFVPSKSGIDPSLRCAAGAVDKTTTHVLVSNWSEKVITLSKGSLLGYMVTHVFSVYSLSLDDEEMYLPQSSFLSSSPSLSSSSKSSHSSFPVDDNVINYTKEEMRKILSESENIDNNLSADERERLIRLLVSHREAFATNPNAPPVTTKTQMHVRLKDSYSQPIRSHPYRVPVHLQKPMRELIDNMIKNNIVKKSSSPWASPVVMVTKPDGSYRFCIDYTKLNNISLNESFPLPNIEEHLDRLSGAKVFTVMDLASGFWQIPVAEGDREKLAFVTPFGTYEPMRMPYGYIGAPSIFQSAISETLDPLLYAFVLFIFLIFSIFLSIGLILPLLIL